MPHSSLLEGNESMAHPPVNQDGDIKNGEV
jgi:hypothetical protein